MGGQTKNTALTTTLAFHYQVLIGLEQCFAMQEGQSVWFERDGDVSLIGASVDESKQFEVKNYADSLTDHHENLWKTIKNWLAPEFNYENYSSLVLLTTQDFGANSTLKDWNQNTVEQRLQVLKDIFETRPKEELSAAKLKPIVQIQIIVMENEDKLKKVLDKMVVVTKAGDDQMVRENVYRRLDGFIPKSNQKAYIESLVGFVYESAVQTKWVIKKDEFDAKREELTSIYRPRPFTIPPFLLRDATVEELAKHEDSLFVQKIQVIEHFDVIPEAVGNWIELHNSLAEELNGTPQFKKTANKYQEQLIRNFNRKHAKAKRNCINHIHTSQDLYDDVIAEKPFGIEGYENPDFVFKNGLIHDAMDDNEQDLQWKVSHD